MTNSNRLHRSSNNSVLFGVAGGMAEYFDVDPTLVRVAWVLFILASGGVALLAYVILAFIMPRDESRAREPSDVVRENLESIPGEIPEAGRRTRRRNLLAFILIAVGVLILLGNLGVFAWWRWDVLWPLVLIGVGVAILVGRARGRI